MADITFVKTRYQDIGYHSYRDLWTLVELAGYPICYVDQIDAYDPSKIFIVTPLNDEWLTGWPNATSRIIHWELEWRIDWRADVDTPPGIAETWASDKWYAGQIGARYVPIGSDIRLNTVGSNFPLKNAFDVSLLSYQTPRRQVVTRQLMDNGLVLAPVSGLEGIRRSLTLVQSRAMVHVHQHDNVPGVAPLRWALAAAHGLPLITESVWDYGIFDYRYMMQSRYETLADYVKNVVRDEHIMGDYAASLQRLLCEEMTFKKVVEMHV